MNFKRFSHRQPRSNTLGSNRLSIQLLPEPTPKGNKRDEFKGGFTLNITNLSRRQPRKSLLGTHRTARESLLPLSEMITVEETLPTSPHRSDRVGNPTSPKPQRSAETTLNSFNSQSSVFSPNPFTSPSHHRVDTSLKAKSTDSSSKMKFSPCKRLETIFSQDTIDDDCEKDDVIIKADANEESILATTLIDNTLIEKSPAQDKITGSVLSPSKTDACFLEPILSQEITNDSFEEYETILKANEDEESILATTLVDESLTNKDQIKSRICDTTMVVDNEIKGVESITSNDNQKELLIEWFKMLDSMILVKNQEADKLQTQLDEVNRQKEEYENMKRRMTLAFKLEEPITKKAQPCCKTSDDEFSQFLSKQSTNAPKTVAVDKTIRDLQSTLKFLKTPRASRLSRSSILLTPHSLSFSVKAQFEKLME